MCDTEFNTTAKTLNLRSNPRITRKNSRTSLHCGKDSKNGTESVNQYVKTPLKLSKATEKVEHEHTFNSDDYKNQKLSEKYYASNKSVKGDILCSDSDLPSNILDVEVANTTVVSERRKSQRLMKTKALNGTTAQTGRIVTKNSTKTSIQHCGTNNNRKSELRANVDINSDLNIRGEKIDISINSMVPADLPQVFQWNVVDTPASPQHFPEPEDYNIKIIPLNRVDGVNNTNINEKEDDEVCSINKNSTQSKFQAGKYSRKGVIKRSTKKKISVLQNIVIHPSDMTFVKENEGEKFGSCDIMSRIMDDMDKDKRLFTMNKNPDKCNIAVTNNKLDDKAWRRIILDVAELTYCDEGMLNFDLEPFVVPIMPQAYLRKRSLLGKVDILLKKLKVTNENENIRDELILEFKRFPPETVVNIILYGLITNQEDTLKKFHPLLLLTKLQWLFLKLMIQLEQAHMRNIFELYLQTAECFPIAEVMVQLIHLKNIKNRNYKLWRLKGLLNDWLQKTINEIFKPLVYKIPVENVEFKATVIVLLANICEHLKISSTDKYMVELNAWFSSLSEGDTPQGIQHSVEYALNKLGVIDMKIKQRKNRKKANAQKKKDLELSRQNGKDMEIGPQRQKNRKKAKAKKKKTLEVSQQNGKS
nr:unnamed protein product [Callosobruchus analis]